MSVSFSLRQFRLERLIDLKLLAFLPFTQKSSGNPYLKVCDLMQYFFANAQMKKKVKKISVRGGTALFGHKVQNNFFALIKKNLLQILVEIIFRYH